MRTTIDLDPDLLERLRTDAARLKVSFKDYLNVVLRRGLQRSAKQAHAYTLPKFDMGGVREGISLDKALALSDALDDAEIAARHRGGR